MRTASVNFLAQLAVDATTLCRLWQITARGRDTIYLTDHDENITFDGDVYVADDSVECSAIENQIGGARTNFEFTAILGNAILKSDAERGVYDGAVVQIDFIFFDHVDYGIMPAALGEVTNTSVPHKDHAVFSCSGFVSKTQHKLTEQYSPTCRAEFCDARCALDIADFTEAITVDAVASQGQFTASEVAAHADGFFDLGTVTFLTGNNAGFSVEVRRSLATGVVHLMIPVPYAIQVGDTADITRGCDKTLPACVAYANKDNFRGEPFVPGADFTSNPAKKLPQGEAAAVPPALGPSWVP